MSTRTTAEQKLPLPCLYLVTDRRQVGKRPLDEVVANAIEAGVTALQLREPDLSGQELYELGKRLRTVTRGKAVLLINDRLDIAQAVDADGVHLRGTSMPTAEVRRLAGSSMIIGRSVRSVEEALQAEREWADYVILGTIFETASKRGLKPAGVGLVKDVRAAVSLPIIPIGGITPANANLVMGAGADGVAVMSAIIAASDPREAARALAGRIAAAYHRRKGQ